MLPRTDRYFGSKCSIAFTIRVCLFFGIPLIYYAFLHDPSLKIQSGNNVFSFRSSSDSSGSFGKLSSRRRLLGVGEWGGGGRNCTRPAITEFPPDGLSATQRRHRYCKASWKRDPDANFSSKLTRGITQSQPLLFLQGFVILHCILAVYCFLLLGNVCEQYFVPAIKVICEKLKMTEDVAGATFMAAASSSPELFINCVGTFVTEGDLGVGTVVGSAVFNVLAVPACCGLLAGKVVDLDWWSVSRDCLMYGVAVVALILTLQDDRVYWYEALALVSTYTLYILAMYFNEGIGRFFKSGCLGFNKRKMFTEVTPLLTKEKNGGLDTSRSFKKIISNVEEGLEMTPQQGDNDLESSTSSVWSWPDESSRVQKTLWLLTWPIGVVLWATVPDCRRHRRLTPLTFFMCILWIGGVSYLVAWIITIIGDTLEIPDSIMGLTFLAAGTSVPEAVSSIIVTNQGHGSMGISNSIGSNTFDIMLCLGLPWLVKSLGYPSTPGQHWVMINSSGLSYSSVTLLTTLLALYAALLINGFRLDWRIGIVCIAVYVAFLALSTLIELNVFFPVNLPVCPH